MTRFPTAGHLVSWASTRPGPSNPPERTKAAPPATATPPGGRPWGGRHGAARTDTFLGSRYRRLARRRGTKRALVAVGSSILAIACHLLSDPDARFTDLGPDWHNRLTPIRRKRQLIAEL